MEFSVLLVSLIAAAAVVSGIVVTLLGLPGNILIFVTALVYGYFDHFTHIDSKTLLILLALLLGGEAVEFLAGSIGAKSEQASKPTLIAALGGALVGGFAGTALLPVIGSISGAVLGAYSASYIAEFIVSGSSAKAKRVAKSAAAGQLLGLISKIIIAIVMVVVILFKLPWS